MWIKENKSVNWEVTRWFRARSPFPASTNRMFMVQMEDDEGPPTTRAETAWTLSPANPVPAPIPVWSQGHIWPVLLIWANITWRLQRPQRTINRFKALLSSDWPASGSLQHIFSMSGGNYEPSSAPVAGRVKTTMLYYRSKYGWSGISCTNTEPIATQRDYWWRRRVNKTSLCLWALRFGKKCLIDVRNWPISFTSCPSCYCLRPAGSPKTTNRRPAWWGGDGVVP